MSREEMMNSEVNHAVHHRLSTRLMLWVALIAPLLIYLLVFPVVARLDKGDTERHFSLEIWRAMGNALPSTDIELVFKLVFFAGGVAAVLGSLWLIWLALDDGHPGNTRHVTQSEQNPASHDDESGFFLSP